MLSHLIDLPESVRHGVPAPTPARRAIKTFRHSIDIYLKDSNAYGNTYFARYFEWQGICRERWLLENIPPEVRHSLGLFITKRAHIEYLDETFPFQRVDCELNSFDVRQCSFYVEFRFAAQGRPVATGYQQLVYASQDKRIQRLPDCMLRHVRAHAMDGNEIVPAC
ncbi:MAG: acyl-CoA thioesterase [Hydrogenophaga sp.]|uniref:acyl-CoA thioesterase n=1 Tax=Hydrogenophaga sp. TaxID=1904254 RepID=UPI00257A9492|nr:acyl-CoA thioesterase [Hydrogenophaga sp.]MBL0943300.1 acyl-CoA thioesterase [Hydrogenophaga sp.]